MNPANLSRPPTVLVLAPLPPPYAGPEILTESLLRSPLRLQFDLRVVNTTLNRANSERGHLRLSNIFRLAVIGCRAVWTLLRYRPRISYMTLSQNTAGFLRDCILFCLLKTAGQEVVLHFHGGNLHVFYARSPRWLQWLIAMVLKNAACVIVLGASIAARLSALPFPIRTAVVWNWSDGPEKFESHGPAPAPGPVTVLALGTISVAKGSADLLHAAAATLDRNSATRFLFAGEIISHEKNVLFDEQGRTIPEEAIARLATDMTRKFPGNIIFLGTVDRQRTWELLRAADILAVPSYSEGFPVAIVEAMAAGLPMICTRAGAIADVLTQDENAVFVEPGDREGLARALESLMNDPARRRAMGAANLRLYRERLTPEKAAVAMGEIFSKAITER